MVLGKLPVPGRPTIWITVGQGPSTLAVGACGGCLDIFTLIYPFLSLSPSLWETVRYSKKYSMKYCLKGPLNPKPTNQHLFYTFQTNIINKINTLVYPASLFLFFSDLCLSFSLSVFSLRSVE